MSRPLRAKLLMVNRWMMMQTRTYGHGVGAAGKRVPQACSGVDYEDRS